MKTIWLTFSLILNLLAVVILIYILTTKETTFAYIVAAISLVLFLYFAFWSLLMLNLTLKKLKELSK